MSEVNLSHYSAQPLIGLVSMEQPSNLGEFYRKPVGLWVSVDGENDWKEWCEGGRFSLHKLAVRQRVILRDTKSLLWLKTPQEILDFQKKYSVPGAVVSYIGIDWAHVAEDYPGIIIAPYQWSLRMNLMWYYGWDCASGCIWDTSIIERLEIQ